MSTATRQTVNYWLQKSCAKTFWSQHELPPYQELLSATTAWLNPLPGERWLDLGCGGGQLTRALWEASHGTLAEVVGVDCAANNEKAYRKLRACLRPAPTADQVRFVPVNFSEGLFAWDDEQFHGVVSGMAIQYAESYCEERGAWTTDAYDRVLNDVYRLLRPGGHFVFSVNVPNPKWGWLALSSVHGFFHSPRPARYLKKAWSMWLYGKWLKQEARRGRFHYLPLGTVVDKLASLGFNDINHMLSYAQQAYLIRCRKPG